MPQRSGAGELALPSVRAQTVPPAPAQAAGVQARVPAGAARHDDRDGAVRSLSGMPAAETAPAEPSTLPPGARPLAPPPDLESAVESLLFVAHEPVEPVAMARVLNVSVARVEEAVDALAARRGASGIRVQRGGGRVQLISAPELGPYVERFLGAAAEQRLSAAALETLAIVAYRQPVTRGTLEAIRGVNSERALATLRARDLVQEVGRAETVGHPVLFGTTMRFLEYFGLQHSDELPPLPDSD